MKPHDERSEEQERLPQQTWPALPSLPQLEGATVPTVGRRFFIYSPSTILKLGTDDGEGTMTALAHSILGPCVPRVVCVVTLLSNASTPTIAQRGLILTRQPGTPLVELWPSLSSSQRERVKTNLGWLLVRMRAHPFTYYGRPARQPYVLFSEFGRETHAYCISRSEWIDSRVHALYASASDTECAVALERVQRSVTGASGWDRPVLTHGDLSARNILVDPHTLEVTGFLDWDMANIMPAYAEYVAARLSGGHQADWRTELLDVLRSILRRECDAGLRRDVDPADIYEGEKRFKRTLLAWDAIVDVERIAQGYDDDCKWTFETGLPDDTSPKTNSTL